MTSDTKETPLISVVMANYNGGAFLREAVESVLGQTYKNFEFIIVDDGSTEDDCLYIQSIKDSRIRLIQNEKNKGQTASLNIGISEAKGDFIARMDSDDVCLPSRFAEQASLFQKEVDVHIIGTQAFVIDANGATTGATNLPNFSNSIWAYAFFQSPFVHPSVMIRGSIFTEYGFQYDENFINQDFDLWSRILPKFKGMNVDKPLLKYRVLPSSMTHRHYDENIINSSNIIMRRLKQENIVSSMTHENLISILRYIFADRKTADAAGIDRAALGLILWDMVRDVAQAKTNLKEFSDVMVWRMFQSCLWLGGVKNMRGRLLLLTKMLFDRPLNTLRLFMIKIPTEIIRRKI